MPIDNRGFVAIRAEGSSVVAFGRVGEYFSYQSDRLTSIHAERGVPHVVIRPLGGASLEVYDVNSGKRIAQLTGVVSAAVRYADHKRLMVTLLPPNRSNFDYITGMFNIETEGFGSQFVSPQEGRQAIALFLETRTASIIVAGRRKAEVGKELFFERVSLADGTATMAPPLPAGLPGYVERLFQLRRPHKPLAVLVERSNTTHGAVVYDAIGQRRVSSLVLYDPFTATTFSALGREQFDIISYDVDENTGIIAAGGQTNTVVLKYPGADNYIQIYSAPGERKNRTGSSWLKTCLLYCEIPGWEVAAVTVVSFSPSGKLLASVHYDSVRVWKTDSAKLLTTIDVGESDERVPTAVAISSNDDTIGIGFADGSAEIWELPLE